MVVVLVTQSCLTLCDAMGCVARQAPLSMGFSRREYWNDCHSLLQRIFLTQGWNPGLLHCRQILYCLSHLGIQVAKNLPANAEDIETLVQFTGRKDPLEEEMATHSSILPWRIP